MPQQFVHLRLHTEYSLKDGLVRVDALMDSVQKSGMRAVAVTDFCNLFAAVKVFKAATASGIKPIFGSDLPCMDAANPRQTSSMLLLCQNETGYKNLTRLVSRAWQEGQLQGEPRIDYAWIREASEGLIALSGGVRGDIGQALLSGDRARAECLATGWSETFPGRFYLEIQRVGRDDEALYNKEVLRLAENLSLPIVATNDVCYLKESEFWAHEARVCIHAGETLSNPSRPRLYTEKQYLRTPEEMAELFADIPEALTNTVEISKRCTVMLHLGKSYLPQFPIPDGGTTEEYLITLSKSGLEERLTRLFGDAAAERRSPYDERLALELSVINAMGFAGYFLIVADFIRWARENGVPVGPGRGSGAGSLVAYALAITDLDPLQYDLLFERFLNPERVSMPDFDIDFCMQGRDRVIEYVAARYGRQSVSQIITFGTMAAKAVLRDVGRVLGHPYGFVDALAKLVPFEIGMTLNKAMEQEDQLRERYENEDEVRELIDLALTLEGITRNAGKHAGGVVIAPSALTDFTPIYCEEGSTQIVSQFDKDDVEAVGLVKFDFLGLKTLTIIDWALKTVNEERAKAGFPPVDISAIPMDDPQTFALLKACQTTAVFQLESRGMKELVHRLQPDCFEDIIALVALFRPGPLQSGMVDDFIDRKHGRAAVAYPHPDLEPILKPTYGVILYQEQVMQIAQVLANYTLGAADLLRRAMGKKKPEEMAQQRAIFTDGAVARGVDAELAASIFDLMEKFAGYGFNKSHSAAYALVAYQTAWLKAHYPGAFMAAVLTADMDNTEKVVHFIDECEHMGLKVLPPCVEHSDFIFTVTGEKVLRYGLGGIRGVGEAVVANLMENRAREGAFGGLFAFCERQDIRRLNRRVLEVLVKSGAMDVWGVERGSLFVSIDKALRLAEKTHQADASGQGSLFAMMEEHPVHEDYVTAAPWTLNQRLDGEKETLGRYLSGHPVDAFRQEFKAFATAVSAPDLLSRKKATVFGLVTGIRRVLTKRGKKLAIIGLEDGQTRIDVVVFQENFEAHERSLTSGTVVVAEGELSRDDFSGGVKMTASKLYTSEEARCHFGRSLTLSLGIKDAEKLTAVKALLSAWSGKCPVQLDYDNGVARARLTLGVEWHVLPTDTLLQHLTGLLGNERVRMRY
ncbi:DNA polymerase III subunit alpha [Legionella geestiana]|uniref:DNA polymerase III subunit alpha n=1 Tax=Legionella geestiana TaxID=45065 RepID=UPI0010921296|nr:DNA polymerase III subunit alpha [Legionella geestiana]QDQ41007.1 DNA polymerase III subunit alpha [Legionella geestiana]